MEVVRIKLRLSNAYLIKDERAVLIDTGATREADHIIAAVERAGVRARDLALILHTHGHMDHAGSTAELQRRLQVPTAIHAEDAAMLRQGSSGPLRPRNLEAALIRPFVSGGFEPSPPDVVFAERFDLAEFGVEGFVLPTPGHTRGSISVLLAQGEAIVGDLMMGGWLGGAVGGTRPHHHYFIDDLARVHESMRSVMASHPRRWHVGHGGPLEADAVRRAFAGVFSP